MTTFVDTTQCEKIKLEGNQGTVAEIANRELCGAENFVGALRWLDEGERFDAESLPDTFQVLYLMEGDGVITLGGKDYAVSKGSGVYLEPAETASISQAGSATTKLFHLVVPKEKA